jgi:hypothetical protein
MIRTLTIAAVTALFLTGTANAFYTECAVTQDLNLARRPSGPTEPRHYVTKGDRVAFRDREGDWWYVIHYASDSGPGDYGWVHKRMLTDCKKMDGTP